MNNIISKFNLYDHFGYMLVGLYQVGIICFIYVLVFGVSIGKIFSIYNIENLLVFILVFYLIGHIVQAIANIFVKENKIGKNNDLDFIYEKARKYFDLPESIGNKYIFQYCYLKSLSNDISGHVALFNSMYSFYRGLFMSSIIGILISIAFILISGLSLFFNCIVDWKLPIYFYAFLLLNGFFIYLFNNRKSRFYEYLGEKVFINFDIITREK